MLASHKHKQRLLCQAHLQPGLSYAQHSLGHAELHDTSEFRWFKLFQGVA
jgi:hypothetical protein